MKHSFRTVALLLVIALMFSATSFAKRKDPKTKKVKVTGLSAAAKRDHADVSSETRSAPSELTGPLLKLKRGLANIFTGPVEIPKYMILEAQRVSPEYWSSFAGVFYGPVKGAGVGLFRMASGFYDVLTFPMPFPPDGGSLIQPEYFSIEESVN